MRYGCHIKQQYLRPTGILSPKRSRSVQSVSYNNERDGSNKNIEHSNIISQLLQTKVLFKIPFQIINSMFLRQFHELCLLLLRWKPRFP